MTFDIGNYDLCRPLIIDPQVVSYSTYLGGPNSEYAHDIAVDAYGSAYITGEAYTGFPQVDPVQPYGGQGDAFVAKLSPDGQTLVYATYIGGSYFDAADSIAVLGHCIAYITGVTKSANFPTMPGAFQTTIGSGYCHGDDSCSDAFVVKLSPTGSSLIYSTFFGGSSAETGEGIALDAAGNAYFMGLTRSDDLPILNGVQPNYSGELCNEGNYYYYWKATASPRIRMATLM